MKSFFNIIINKIINFTHDKAIYLLTDHLKRQLFIIYSSLMLFYHCHYAAVLALTMQPIWSETLSNLSNTTKLILLDSLIKDVSTKFFLWKLGSIWKYGRTGYINLHCKTCSQLSSSHKKSSGHNMYKPFWR